MQKSKEELLFDNISSMLSIIRIKIEKNIDAEFINTTLDYIIETLNKAFNNKKLLFKEEHFNKVLERSEALKINNNTIYIKKLIYLKDFLKFSKVKIIRNQKINNILLD